MARENLQAVSDRVGRLEVGERKVGRRNLGWRDGGKRGGMGVWLGAERGPGWQVAAGGGGGAVGGHRMGMEAWAQAAENPCSRMHVLTRRSCLHMGTIRRRRRSGGMRRRRWRRT